MSAVARILVVCTANVCRSPAAAGLLARVLPGVEVVSRGIRVRPGMSVCPTTAQWLAGFGVDASGHVPTALTEDDVRAATLVLTAGRRHRAEVAALRGSAAVRTHTLAEAARLVADVPPQTWWSGPADDSERVLALAEGLYRVRSQPDAAAAGPQDDVPDPHSGTPHEEVLGRIGECLAALDRVLSAGPDLSDRPAPDAGPPAWAGPRRRARAGR